MVAVVERGVGGWARDRSGKPAAAEEVCGART